VPAALPRPKFTDVILVAILIAIFGLTAAVRARDASEATAAVRARDASEATTQAPKKKQS
jgi:hypothetical protein